MSPRVRVGRGRCGAAARVEGVVFGGSTQPLGAGCYALLLLGAAVDSGSRRGLNDGFGTVAATQLRVEGAQVVNYTLQPWPGLNRVRASSVAERVGMGSF